MNYEVICYKDQKESNHSPYFKTLEQAENWIKFNVKVSEQADVLAVVTKRLVQRYRGMELVWEA